jgi:hypothetical protein
MDEKGITEGNGGWVRIAILKRGLEKEDGIGIPGRWG